MQWLLQTVSVIMTYYATYVVFSLREVFLKHHHETEKTATTHTAGLDSNEISMP